ncbi:MAG TPA: hypothetical protein VF821_22155 [Lentzea sp.]
MTGLSTDADDIATLIAACRLYHDALDRAFALLIEYSRPDRRRPDLFFPSRSDMFRDMVEARKVVDLIEAAQRKKARH